MTVPPPPAQAVETFGRALPQVERYAAELAGPALLRGLIGPDEIPRLWPRHLLNCAGLLPALDEVVAKRPRPTVIDLGSGAGLPGVVIAVMRPSWRIVLLEPQLRRTAFLTEVARLLELDNVAVLRTRAEDAPVRGDVVVARAVAPLHRLVPWALPLVLPGGALLALKGERAREEAERDAAAVRRAGGVVAQVHPVRLGPGWVVRVEPVPAGRGRSTSAPEPGTMTPRSPRDAQKGRR